MASFAHALRSFNGGELSAEQLIAELERILRDGRGDVDWLLQTLAEEHTRVPLPDDIHAVIKQRIEEAAKHRPRHENWADLVGDFQDTDASRTCLDIRPVGAAHSPRAAADPLTDVDRIKGVGDVLNDRFVLEERVGSGGMSTVYKALDRRKLEADDRNPYVAVKVLNVEFRAHPQSLIALQREAKKSQSLAHPNIVRVYDFDRDGATVYMTMEFLSGKPLSQRFRAPNFRGMPSNEAMPILGQIEEALNFAHNNGIVHADFKPANVIITDNGQVKLIDFGIARAFKRPDQIDMEATRFDPGTLGALTPTYASPEMLEQQEVDPRDDVYALGCIAYEMLTGRHPFGRMQATEARDAGLQVECRKGLTRTQYKALKGALAFEREKRTPTVEQFGRELHRDETRSTAKVGLSALAVLTLVALGLGGYYYARSRVPAVPSAPRAQAQAVPPAPDVPSNVVPPAAEALPNATPRVADTQLQTAPAQLPVNREALPAPPPTPVTAAAGPLKLSAVLPVLDRIQCAALDASVSDGFVQVRGYASSHLDAKGLENELRALPGAMKVATQITPVSDEKCNVLDVYKAYWRANRTAGEAATVRVQGGHSQLTEGDALIVKITTPPYESYVSLDYYSLDGGVVHMVPSPGSEANRAPPNYAATVGDLGQWTIAKPFGAELVVVLNTPQPLFKHPRKEIEKGTDYLAALRERLEQLSKDVGSDRITADFIIINSKPRPRATTDGDVMGRR